MSGKLPDVAKLTIPKIVSAISFLRLTEIKPYFRKKFKGHMT
jgi:hypothetical protein